MTILVTGSSGFIGFHTIIALLKKGENVIGVDNLNSYYDKKLKISRNKSILNFIKKYKLKNKYKFIKLDISNNKSLEKIFKKYHFKKVVHLAAQAGDLEEDLWRRGALVGAGNLETDLGVRTEHLVTVVPFSRQWLVISSKDYSARK